MACDRLTADMLRAAMARKPSRYPRTVLILPAWLYDDLAAAGNIDLAKHGYVRDEAYIPHGEDVT